MKDLPRIVDMSPESVCEAALEVTTCIAEALDLTERQVHYAALALEAKAGEPDVDPAFARLATAVARRFRESEL